MDDMRDIWVNMTSSCRYLADGSFTILRDVSSWFEGHPPPELEGRGRRRIFGRTLHAILACFGSRDSNRDHASSIGDG